MYDVSEPYRAFGRARKCGMSYCHDPVAAGDIVVRYVRRIDENNALSGLEPAGEPFHITHHLERLNERIRSLETDLERTLRVTDTVLALCAGLSAVNADWLLEQRRALDRRF